MLLFISAPRRACQCLFDWQQLDRRVCVSLNLNLEKPLRSRFLVVFHCILQTRVFQIYVKRPVRKNGITLCKFGLKWSDLISQTNELLKANKYKIYSISITWWEDFYPKVFTRFWQLTHTLTHTPMGATTQGAGHPSGALCSSVASPRTLRYVDRKRWGSCCQPCDHWTTHSTSWSPATASPDKLDWDCQQFCISKIWKIVFNF